ncbi:MAG: ATP-binding protein, partial [Exiguobacterium undae]
MNDKVYLTCFEIEGLNNDKNVALTFDKNIRILLGENGTGKTTILTVFYYVLSRKFYNLSNIDFSKINIKLSTNETITLHKEWFSLDGNENAYKYYKMLEEDLSDKELEYALEIVYGNGTFEYFRSFFKESIDKKRLSFMRLRRYINELKTTLRDNGTYQYSEDILKVEKKLKEVFSDEILYFPTYRRIEDDLAKLGLSINSDNDNFSNKYGVINFGMNDVQEGFDKIKSDIKDESLISYSNVTGNMIKHLIYPDQKQNLITFDDTIFENRELLKISLERF